MKSKSIFLMAVSLGFGLVAAIGITQVMGRNKPEPAAEVAKQSVLVAVEDLDINTELTPEMFSEEQWPIDLVPDGVLTDLAEIEGKVTTSRVGKKGPVFLSNLVNKSELRQKTIPAGFKVIGVQMGSDDHISGLLEPGDLVDLIAVFRNNKSAGPSSQTFLRKVRVFSVASRTTKDPENHTGAKGNTVVGLLVTEKQSEQIVLVKKVAELKLAMRSNQETEDSLASQSSGSRLGDFTGDNPGGGVGDVGALAKLFSNSLLNSGPKASAGALAEPEMEQFTMVVYTSEGPTQYHFDANKSSIPERIEGFSAQKEEAASESSPLDNMVDLEDSAADEDSDLLIDDLDSEPGA